MTTEPSLSQMKIEKRENAIRQERGIAEANIAARANIVKTKDRERIAEVKRLKEKDRRLYRDLPNMKIDPVEGRSPQGELVKVNRNTGPGHFLALHRAKPEIWTKPMIDAAARFGRDYELTEFGGIAAASLEPRVDSSISSGDGKSAVSIIARQRLLDLKRRIGPDDFIILECSAGIGMTQTEMHARGMGDKRTLGERLRLALNRAAAFYGGLREDPQSQFYKAAYRVIEHIKRR